MCVFDLVGTGSEDQSVPLEILTFTDSHLSPFGASDPHLRTN